MTEDDLYIRAAREALQKDGASRLESLWREARERAGKNEFEAVNLYVNLRVDQLRKESPEPGSARTTAGVASVGGHPDFISVAKYCAKNNVDQRHVIQSIGDGHYIGREVGGDWYIYIGKSRFSTHEERKKSFFFDDANALAESERSEEDRDNLINLDRTPE
ncbi:MAG: hypothetical protein P8X86_01080 [Desulfofustis sp.]|jgi:hypothetical protein